MGKDGFFEDKKYLFLSEANKSLIQSLVKLFGNKCITNFHPVWRESESGTKVFKLESEKGLKGKSGKPRLNIVTIRLKAAHLDIEVYGGEYCKGNEFHYRLSTSDDELSLLYKDMNSTFSDPVVKPDLSL